MAKEYYEKMLALVREKNTELYFSTLGFWITAEEYELYKKEMKSLEEKYINISIKNRESKNNNAFRVSSIIGIIPEWEPSIFHKVEKNY